MHLYMHLLQLVKNGELIPLTRYMLSANTRNSSLRASHIYGLYSAQSSCRLCTIPEIHQWARVKFRSYFNTDTLYLESQWLYSFSFRKFYSEAIFSTHKV